MDMKFEYCNIDFTFEEGSEACGDYYYYDDGILSFIYRDIHGNVFYEQKAKIDFNSVGFDYFKAAMDLFFEVSDLWVFEYVVRYARNHQRFTYKELREGWYRQEKEGGN